jgi:rootletin
LLEFLQVKALENEKRSLERQLSSARSSGMRSKSYERQEKAHAELLGSGYGPEQLEQENRELRLKMRRLECQLAEREAEVARLKSQVAHSHSASVLDLARERGSEVERYRAAQLQAEKLLEAREQSHRQQVVRLDGQVRPGVGGLIGALIQSSRPKPSKVQTMFEVRPSQVKDWAAVIF